MYIVLTFLLWFFKIILCYLIFLKVNTSLILTECLLKILLVLYKKETLIWMRFIIWYLKHIWVSMRNILITYLYLSIFYNLMNLILILVRLKDLILTKFFWFFILFYYLLLEALSSGKHWSKFINLFISIRLIIFTFSLIGFQNTFLLIFFKNIFELRKQLLLLNSLNIVFEIFVI